MKTYDFALSAAMNKSMLQVSGFAFYYVNGTSAGNSTITIKPERGEDFDLKPGQWMRLPVNVGTWYIGSKDGTSTITGQFIIGDGVFGDSNIFSTTVIAPGQSVGINNIPHVIDRPEAITGSYADTSPQTANTNLQIVAAAANVNGVIVHNAQLIWTGSGRQSFIAKATAPTAIFDGTVILSQDTVGAAGTYGARDVYLQNAILVPAGQAIWYRTVGDPSGFFRMLHYTVL
ncbi:hypothetical protein ACO0LL_05650 [Undibacterium sp. TC4M20W]|uniref:hypothetical protein n=1 Tax=Undibacterium sp. TC4M20W TaxID=3413052 RepID=UPI003BF3EF96